MRLQGWTDTHEPAAVVKKGGCGLMCSPGLLPLPLGNALWQSTTYYLTHSAGYVSLAVPALVPEQV